MDLPEVVEFRHLNGRVLTASDLVEDTLDVEQELLRTGLDQDGLPVGSVRVLTRFTMLKASNAPAIGDLISFDPELINLAIRRVDQQFVLRVTRVYAHTYKGRFQGLGQAQVWAEGLWLDGTYLIDWINQAPFEELKKRAARPGDPVSRARAIKMARKVKALWERPGTEGERQAAVAALKRLMEANDLTEMDLR